MFKHCLHTYNITCFLVGVNSFVNKSFFIYLNKRLDLLIVLQYIKGMETITNQKGNKMASHTGRKTHYLFLIFAERGETIDLHSLEGRRLMRLSVEDLRNMLKDEKRENRRAKDLKILTENEGV